MCDTTKNVPDVQAGPQSIQQPGMGMGDPMDLAGSGGGKVNLGAPTKTVPTKFGSFLKYALPAMQGAAYGAGSAEPTRALGGSGFGAALASSMGRVGAHNQQMKMLQYQMGLEGMDRQLRLATLQNTMRHQGAMEDTSERKATVSEQRMRDLEDKLQQGEWKPIPAEEQPVDQGPLERNTRTNAVRPMMPQPSGGQTTAPTTAGGEGGSSPALPEMAGITSGMLEPFSGTTPSGGSIKGSVPPGMFAGGPTAPAKFNSGSPNRPAVAPTAPAAAAQAATAPASGKLDQLNQGLTSIYQAANPGKPLPLQFTLQPGSTKADFDRVKGMLDDMDRASMTKAQRDTVNEMRRQTQELAKSKQDQSDQALDVAAKSIAGGDLTSIKDITSMRSDQRLLLYAKIKNLAPGFDTSKLQRQIEMMDNFSNKKQGDQLQSFGTFLEHAGALKDTMDGLGNTDAKILNKPINWLRQNVGSDPAINKVLGALDPVQKEFESYLLNNRALYTSDRETVDKIVSGDLPPAQLVGALQQMGHTVQARYNEADNRFKNTMNGKHIEDFFPMTDEAKDGALKIGVTVGSGGSSGGGNIHPLAAAYISKLGTKSGGRPTANAAAKP